jgi:hypothetical protein
MHARRFACFFLGIWLGSGLFLAWMAWQNQKVAGRLMSQADPGARLQLKAMGPNGPAILHYEAAEESREAYRVWETIQLLAGCLFFGFLLFGSEEGPRLLGGVLLLVLLVAVQRFLLTPEVIAEGRLIDFAPPGTEDGARNRLWLMHNAYMLVEVAKWLLTLLLVGRMVTSSRGSGRSRDSRRQLDRVDKSNYSGVYR